MKIDSLKINKKNTYNEKFYEDIDNSSYQSAKIYLDYLWQFIKPMSVLDVGCGRGAWLKACEELGSKDITGLDGSWLDQTKMTSRKIKFKSIDLNKIFSVEKKVDLTMSLEVAEHIDRRNSRQFIECLTTTSDVIMFSAAYEYQGGTDHINENKHSYWAKIFDNLDYTVYDIFRPHFWSDERVGFWFRQNTFLYVKKGSDQVKKFNELGITEIKNIEFMDCIHPNLYEHKCGQELSFKIYAKNIFPSLFRAIKKRL